MASFANPYFTKNSRSEQNLLEGLITESIQVSGQKYYYLPRNITTESNVFTEDIVSEFNYALDIEMYQESSHGWDSDTNLLSKFGLSMSNQINLVISKSRWEQEIKKYPDISTMSVGGIRPQEGDIIFEPITKSLLEIKFVKNSNSDFFQLGKMYQYRLTCELFQYSNEKFNTGIKEIDAFNTNSLDILLGQLLTENSESIELEEGCSYLLTDSIEQYTADTSDCFCVPDISDILLPAVNPNDRSYGKEFESVNSAFNISNPFNE